MWKFENGLMSWIIYNLEMHRKLDLSTFYLSSFVKFVVWTEIGV